MNDVSDHLRDVFRSAGRRLTPQRMLILQVLQEADKHLDAEAVHDRVKQKDPDISLATVYRTLAVLREMGLVDALFLDAERSRYESTGSMPHYHFTCLGCGKVMEFDTPLIAELGRELNQREGVRVVGTRLHMVGYCAACLAQMGGRSDNAG